MWHREIQNLVNLRKSDLALNIEGIDSSRHDLELSIPTTIILNSSFQEGFVPSQWKQANVAPIPKVTPPSLQKLRPISLTPIISKVAESFLCRWEMSSIYPKLDSRQFGNRKGYSTTHC